MLAFFASYNGNCNFNTKGAWVDALAPERFD